MAEFRNSNSAALPALLFMEVVWVFFLAPHPLPDSGCLLHLHSLLKERYLGEGGTPLIKSRQKEEFRGGGGLETAMSATLVGVHLYTVYSPGAVDSLCHLWPDNGLPNSCSQYKETLAGTLFLNKHRPSGRSRSIKMLTGPEKQYFSSWFVWRLRGREWCEQIR